MGEDTLGHGEEGQQPLLVELPRSLFSSPSPNRASIRVQLGIPSYIICSRSLPRLIQTMFCLAYFLPHIPSLSYCGAHNFYLHSLFLLQDLFSLSPSLAAQCAASLLDCVHFLNPSLAFPLIVWLMGHGF